MELSGVFADYETRVKDSLKSGDWIGYKINYVNREAMDYLIQVLYQMLKTLNKQYMKEPISYFVREFVSNANKSNLKKVHFQLHGLDMKDSDTYYKGMESFAKDFRDKLDTYVDQINKSGYYTETAYQIKDNNLKILIKNSGVPTPQEAAKVQKLVERSKSIHDAAEAFMAVADSSEGAGLGVVSAMLMLRSLGLDETKYVFKSDRANKETHVQVEIPLDTVTESQVEAITEVIAKAIDSIPVFPDKIEQIQSLLSKSQVDLSQIASVIQTDVGLTAELLKIVNSAQYMLPQKVSNIPNAVSLIGIKGLKSLLYSYGAQDILQKKFGRMETIWEHSYRCGSYAYNIARDFKMRDLMDDAYIGGILHDIGKIILLHQYPELSEKISGYCGEKGIGNELIENIAVGASHARVGAEMAKKWNFPEIITSVIEFHHKPLLAPDNYKNIVNIVYLANALTFVGTKNYRYSGLEKDVLDQFGIKNSKDLIELKSNLDGYYQQQKSKSQKEGE